MEYFEVIHCKNKTHNLMKFLEHSVFDNRYVKTYQPQNHSEFQEPHLKQFFHIPQYHRLYPQNPI